MVGKMNRRGWIRIVEASVAILIVFGALIVFRTNGATTTTRDLNDRIYPILDEIAKNNVLREEVLNYDISAGLENSENAEIISNLKDFIRTKISDKNLNFDVKICSGEEICGLENYPSDAGNNLYSAERIVTASVENPNFEPRKVKMFLWEKTAMSQ